MCLKSWLILILLGAGPAPASLAADQPLAKDLVTSVKTFCNQFEGVAAKKLASSAAAQCIELINSGVSQGRFRFDRAQASLCLSAQVNGMTLTACQSVLTGNKIVGDKCESSIDCQKPYICKGAQASQTGKCTAPLSIGSPSDDESVYASHFFAVSNRGVCASGLHCAVGHNQICAKD